MGQGCKREILGLCAFGGAFQRQLKLKSNPGG